MNARRWLVILSLLMAAPARADDPEEPPPLPDPPASFVAGDVEADAAYFVRLRTATIGGNFDSAGSEEVHVFVQVGAAERQLAAQVLPLENTLKEYAFEASPYLELSPGDPIAFDLEVRDADLTEWETIAGAKEPCRVEAAAFGRAQATRLRVELDTIRGSSWSLFGTKTFRIEGASLELELRQAPRRDGPDDELRAALDRAFGALASGPDATVAEAALAEARLRRAAIAAMNLARRSVHTGVRRRLPPLAQAAYDLADVAARLAAAPSDPAPLRRVLAATADLLDRCAERDGPGDVTAALKASAEAVRATTLPNRIGPDSLDAVLAAQERLDAERKRHRPFLRELRWEETAFAEAYTEALERLDVVAAQLADARAAHQEGPRLLTGWKDLLLRVGEAGQR